jgi:outer membrane immunogenic protein
MKKVVLTGLALGLCSFAPAIAADVPIRTPFAAPAVSLYNWTGFYLGGNIGYGWGNGDTSFTPLPTAAGFINLAPTTLSVRPRGVLGGIQGGYNWQTAGFVLGLEADFQGASINGNTTTSPIIQFNGTPFGAGSSLSATEDLNWFGTVRGRLGFTPIDRVLIYGTGGLAYGNVTYSANSDFRPVGTQ